MHKTLFSLIVFILMLIFSFCSNPTESSNNPPELIEIILDRQFIWGNEKVFITAIATDKDGDSLSYYWKCSGGKILTGSRSDYEINYYSPITNPALWQTPGAGQYSITCTVSDGISIDSDSIIVTVH